MSWFAKNNDDDIDDIYDKLEDIYNRLEALDIVSAFSGRLSKLEKTCSYLESVLLENAKDLEKHINKLDEEHKNLSNDIGNIYDTISCIKDSVSKTQNVEKPEINRDFMFELEYLKEDLKSLKVILKNNDLENIRTEFNNQIKEIDDIIKNLVLKTSYLELSKDRTPNYLQEIENLKKEITNKDNQINILNDKINSLNSIIDEDSKSIKLVAKYIINQAQSIQDLKDELNLLKDKNRS